MGIYIPDDKFRIEACDSIHVIGTPYDLRRLYLGEFGDKTDIKSSVIIGASRISYYLASDLIKKGYDVKIIEIDENKAKRFHRQVPGAVVIHGDGANSVFLAEENFEQYDSAIALTGIDERNILIALLAEKANIREVVTRVDNKNLLRITGILDIDVTVTPIKEAANHILRIIRGKENISGFSISNFYLLEDNEVEAAEFIVLEDSKIVDIPIKNLNIKKDTIIAFIEKHDSGKVITPNGNDTIDIDDKVVIITKKKAFKHIDDILEER